MKKLCPLRFLSPAVLEEAVSPAVLPCSSPPLFDFPPSIRRAIYTTNAIESVNSVIRKFTRNRKIYPNEASALKLVYMAINEASKRWTRPIHHWKQALYHFAIMFEERMAEHISNQRTNVS